MCWRYKLLEDFFAKAVVTTTVSKKIREKLVDSMQIDCVVDDNCFFWDYIVMRHSLLNFNLNAWLAIFHGIPQRLMHGKKHWKNRKNKGKRHVNAGGLKVVRHLHPKSWQDLKNKKRWASIWSAWGSTIQRTIHSRANQCAAKGRVWWRVCASTRPQ